MSSSAKIMFSDASLKRIITDFHFEKSSVSHEEFHNWVSESFSKVFASNLEPCDLGISDISAEILMDIDAQWGLYCSEKKINRQNKINELAIENLPDSYFSAWYRKLHNEALGRAGNLGWHLQTEIETKLIHDLKQYWDKKQKLHFDWSKTNSVGSCQTIKGRMVSKISNIVLLDYQRKLIFHGTMDFVFSKKHNYFFEAFWDELTQDGIQVKCSGTPDSILRMLPSGYKQLD